MEEIEKNHNLKKKTISGVFWKGLERIGAQLVSAIVSIILARLLMPEDYSVVSIVTIFFTFCNIFISGGLNSSLIHKKDADSLDYSTILISNMIMASFFYMVMFFLAPVIANLFEKEILVLVIRVMSISFFINGYKAILSAKITSDMRFKSFFISTIIGTAISAVIGIIMAVRGFGVWALVVQQLVNSFVDALILTFSSKIRLVPKFSRERFKRLFKFGGKIMLSSLINETYNQTKPLIVGLKYSAVDLAYYNKGKTYPAMFASLGNDTLASSLFPAMSKIQNDKEAILKVTRRFMQLSSFLVFPIMMGFFGISEGFVRVLLTDKWLPVVPFLMIFCISDMFKPIQTGNLQAIRAIGRSDVFLALEIIKKSLYFSIIIAFVFLTHDAVALALSGIITSILASFINAFPNKKLIGYTYFDQLKDILPNLLTSVAMGVGVYFMKYIPINMYLLLAIQVVTGIIFYFGVNLLIRNKSLIYAVATVKEFLQKSKKASNNKTSVVSCPDHDAVPDNNRIETKEKPSDKDTDLDNKT